MDNRSTFKLALVATAMTSVHCGAADYFLSSRPLSTEFDMYVGADWFALNDGTKSAALVLEPRLMTEIDLDVSLRFEAHHANEDQFDAFERGDVTIDAAWGWWFEDSAVLDYASVEAGYVEPAESAALSSGTEYFVTGRLYGGPTLLGFELGATYANLRPDLAGADSALIYSVGVRSMYFDLNIGFDVLHQEFQGGSGNHAATLGQVVLMKRFATGGEFYVFGREGLSKSFEDSYLGIGYRAKFGRRKSP